MKKFIIKTIFIIAISIVATTKADASEIIYYVNNNGVEMTEEQYNFLLNLCDEEMIKIMTQKRFDLWNNIVDYSQNTAYVVETETYDAFGNVTGTLSAEVQSEDEAINMANELNQYSTYGSASHTTNAKKLTFTVSRFFNDNKYRILISTDTIWLNNGVPYIKSYDVSAHRFTTSGSLFLNAIDAEGYQTYNSNGAVTYSFNGDNSVNYYNGYGTSMNIVDAATKNLRLSLDVVYEYSGTGTVTGYGTYQHSTEYISLEDSKGYIFAAGGLGNVLYYSNTTIRGYFDQMQGVSTTLSV